MEGAAVGAATTMYYGMNVRWIVDVAMVGVGVAQECSTHLCSWPSPTYALLGAS